MTLAPRGRFCALRFSTTGARYHEADLLRLKAELLLAQQSASTEEAEAFLQRALQVAREQQARLWELHAAMILARLWRDQDRRAEAHALLAPLYTWFTEGLAAPLLQGAKKLLQQSA